MGFSKNIIIKPRKVYDYYCIDCPSFVVGDGSRLNPWHCGCGQYEYDWSMNGFKSTSPEEIWQEQS